MQGCCNTRTSSCVQELHSMQAMATFHPERVAASLSCKGSLAFNDGSHSCRRLGYPSYIEVTSGQHKHKEESF